jgi:anthranilate phosphoribosyltransferase
MDFHCDVMVRILNDSAPWGGAMRRLLKRRDGMERVSSFSPMRKLGALIHVDIFQPTALTWASFQAGLFALWALSCAIMEPVPLVPFIQRISAGENLSPDDAHRAMSVLLEGEATHAEIADFLIALKTKGETAEELAGFARAMRERSVFVDGGQNLIDTCGTGGTGDGTFNISTVAALVMAGAGAKVAKHGNRSISSPTGGSAEMVEALGVRFAMTPGDAARAIREIGIGFLYAPHLHPAMKHAQPVRRELKVRTVFNLLGPLANPARAQSQLIGVPSREAAKLMADALSMLEAFGTAPEKMHAFVVHGHDGLDEISITGPTDVYEVWTGRVEKHVWTPGNFGVDPGIAVGASADLAAIRAALRGGDGARNAEIALEILGGAIGPRRDIVLMNAAAGLVAGGLAADLRQGMNMAAHSIDSGAARDRLTQLQKHFPWS